VRTPVSAEPEIAAARPGIAVRFRVAVHLASIVVFVSLEATNIACGLLV